MWATRSTQKLAHVLGTWGNRENPDVGHVDTDVHEVPAPIKVKKIKNKWKMAQAIAHELQVTYGTCIGIVSFGTLNGNDSSPFRFDQGTGRSG